MQALQLHDFHARRAATFTEVNGHEWVDHYGSMAAEYEALHQSVGLVDMSQRARLCVTGADRLRFLNGQVTNNVKDLAVGQGCHAAIVNAKAKMESDLYAYRLPDEILLDLEPGYGDRIRQRLDAYIIADDVAVLDVMPHYGLWSILGPAAPQVMSALGPPWEWPEKPLEIRLTQHPQGGEVYCACQSRCAERGYDIYVPAASMSMVGETLLKIVTERGGRLCGWQALETCRIEAGQPRFGQDMDESNLPPEAGLEATAIDYGKGCYIGQEIIARLRTYGRVSKALRGLRLEDGVPELPGKGEKLFHGDKEVGYITSSVRSPRLQGNLALGYVRREYQEPGTVLTWHTAEGNSEAVVMTLPPVARPSE